MPPCFWRGNTLRSSVKRLGLLSLCLTGSGCIRLHQACLRQSRSSSMLAATIRSTSAARAPAASLAVLGRGCACFCAPALRRDGGRGRRRHRHSEVTVARRISTARRGGGGGEGGAAGLGAAEEERRRVQGMVSSVSPSSISAFKQCPQLFYYR